MRHLIWAHTLALLIAASAPALVQAQQPDTEADPAAQTTDREDKGEWGWLGLLGLAGLFGLKRPREHVTHGAPAR